MDPGEGGSGADDRVDQLCAFQSGTSAGWVRGAQGVLTYPYTLSSTFCISLCSTTSASKPTSSTSPAILASSHPFPLSSTYAASNSMIPRSASNDTCTETIPGICEICPSMLATHAPHCASAHCQITYWWPTHRHAANLELHTLHLAHLAIQ